MCLLVLQYERITYGNQLSDEEEVCEEADCGNEEPVKKGKRKKITSKVIKIILWHLLIGIQVILHK